LFPHRGEIREMGEIREIREIREELKLQT